MVEVINIGFGRAAASLSKLTGQRVQLEVPQITMCPVEELSDRLRPVIDQVFPFEQAIEAYRHFESRAHFGKVVISHG